MFILGGDMVLRRVIATDGYTASKDGELSFDEGDTIEILDESEDDRLRGRLRGEIGLVSPKYITGMDAESSNIVHRRPEGDEPKMKKHTEETGKSFCFVAFRKLIYIFF
jgi:hypothetical protein